MMGTNPDWLALFIELAADNRFAPDDGVLDIGAQQFFCAAQQDSINDFLRQLRAEEYSQDDLQRIADGGFVGDVFTRAGFRYASIDFADHPYVIRLDLNKDALPREHWGRYRFVSNGGTSEHILNQYNVFEAIHNATVVGGLIFHGVPMGGDYSHGIISYNPKFFWALAEANDYQIQKFWGWSSNEVAALSPTFSDGPQGIAFNIPPRSNVHWLHVIMRKTKDREFRGLVDPAFALG